MSDEQRNSVRQSLRQARQALTADQQDAAAASLFELISGQDFFQDAQSIAFYQAFEGELNPQQLLELALDEGKSCFLPVIAATSPEFISFAPFEKGTTLSENHWGIAEPPLPEAHISPTEFDLVLVPLVGFDENCFRLGMGKGFYDRTFSFKIFNRRSRPLLVGLAHECQRVEPFPVQSWDVRMDAVATAEKIYRPDTA